MFQKAAILSMMSEEEQKKTGEDVVELFRSGGRLRTPEDSRAPAHVSMSPQAGGGSEAAAGGEVHPNGEVRRQEVQTLPGQHRRPAGRPCAGSLSSAGLCLHLDSVLLDSALCPGLVSVLLSPQEMMYVWNGFNVVAKRPDCTRALLVTIETAEERLRGDPCEPSTSVQMLVDAGHLLTAVCAAGPSEFQPDDSCLLQLLKGLCLRHLDRWMQAELCFTQVLAR